MTVLVLETEEEENRALREGFIALTIKVVIIIINIKLRRCAMVAK